MKTADLHVWKYCQVSPECGPGYKPLYASLLSLSPSQSPGAPGVPVIPSGGVQSPAAVLGAQGWGECWKRMNMVSSSLCLSARSFTYCCFILISYHFFSSQLPCFTCCWSVLRLLYVFRICLFVCWSVHPHLSCASSLIMCTIITSHTLFQCDFTLVDFYACSEYQHSYCE